MTEGRIPPGCFTDKAWIIHEEFMRSMWELRCRRALEMKVNNKKIERFILLLHSDLLLLMESANHFQWFVLDEKRTKKIKTWIFLPHSCWCFLKESAKLLRCFAKYYLFFFPWWKKNQKNQDLDFFAKKIEFLQENFQNSGGKKMDLCVRRFLPPLKQWKFLCGDYWDGSLGRNSIFS